jgi:hypothetical protein
MKRAMNAYIEIREVVAVPPPAAGSAVLVRTERRSNPVPGTYAHR